MSRAGEIASSAVALCEHHFFQESIVHFRSYAETIFSTREVAQNRSFS